MNLLHNTEILDDLELFKWTAEKLPIRFVGDPILTTPCEPIDADAIATPEIQELAKGMLDTLTTYREKAGMGRGLAANQIGSNKRMIVVWLNKEPEIFINPEILSVEGTGSYWESCISTGSFLIGEIIRPWKGTFRYLDLNGNEKTLEADEKQTRLLLHEIDHLNGELCIHKYEPKTLCFVEKGKEQVLSYEFKRLD